MMRTVGVSEAAEPRLTSGLVDLAGFGDRLHLRDALDRPAFLLQPLVEVGLRLPVTFGDEASVAERVNAGDSRPRVDSPFLRRFHFLREPFQVVPARRFSYRDPTCHACSSRSWVT